MSIQTQPMLYYQCQSGHDLSEPMLYYQCKFGHDLLKPMLYYQSQFGLNLFEPIPNLFLTFKNLIQDSSCSLND